MTASVAAVTVSMVLVETNKQQIHQDRGDSYIKWHRLFIYPQEPRPTGRSILSLFMTQHFHVHLRGHFWMYTTLPMQKTHEHWIYKGVTNPEQKSPKWNKTHSGEIMTHRTNEMRQSAPPVERQIKNSALNLLSVCSFVNRWSVSGLKQSTGSQSHLSLLSNCCFSNLSLMPRWAPGKSCCASGLVQNKISLCHRSLQIISSTLAIITHSTLWKKLGLTTGLNQLWDKCDK